MGFRRSAMALVAVALALAVTFSGSFGSASAVTNLAKRGFFPIPIIFPLFWPFVQHQVPIACYHHPHPKQPFNPSSTSGSATSSSSGPLPTSSPAPCVCPKDNNRDSGVLINVFPGYQCAYPTGACTWSDTTGQLQNTDQTNCPADAPCPASGCVCPADNNGDKGVLINNFSGYQCAYPNGACTWDFDGNLQNTMQTNCPSHEVCVPPSS